MGVAGSGKSTVGALLASALDAVFIDADTLHSAANVAKMASGLPLDDADRWPWLAACADAMRSAVAAGQTVVLGCSGLKKNYRDVLRSFGGSVLFVHLDGSPELLTARISQPRVDPFTGQPGAHYMKPSMLASQLSAFEPLDPSENGLVVSIAKPPAEIVTEILAALS